MVNCIFDLVIFGGTGDLSRRKLLPALFNGFVAGYYGKSSQIILTSRTASDQTTVEFLRDVFEISSPDCDYEHSDLEKFAAIVRLVELNLVKEGDDWQSLAESLVKTSSRPQVYFLAIPPSAFADTCRLLGHYGLNGENVRVVIEKPLGHDLASAKAINDVVAWSFSESQIFRIDHYLGKEAVQNLLALRFSNILFERLWNSQTIDHIQITIAEDVGTSGRAAYYDKIGALRDMVQNHLLQLLCLIAMEPPAQLNAENIREEKLKVLKSLKPLKGADIARNVVRGQYCASDDGSKGSYTEDIEQSDASGTETYVAIRAHVENWRWAGVPFYLRTGKRLPERFAEIVIQFKEIPHTPQVAWVGKTEPNRFVIHLQPDDYLALHMMLKSHSDSPEHLREVEMNLDNDPQGTKARQGPYLRLILDAVRGDQSLFVHRKEVEAAWNWIDPIIDHWQSDNESLMLYPADSWGPGAAQDLLRRDGRKWFHERVSKGSI